jgi:hypothetical protein
LHFDMQVASVGRSSYCHLRMLHRVSKFLHMQHRMLLAQSLIISRINYCVPLYAGIAKKLEMRLQRIINSAIRVALNLKKSASISPILKREGILPVNVRIKCRIAILVHQVLSGCCPSSICDMVKIATPVRSLRSEGVSQLEVPKTRLSLGDRAFSSIAPRIWNAIPMEIRETEYSSFSAKLQHYFKNVHLD